MDEPSLVPRVAPAPSWLHVAEGLQLASIGRAGFDRWVNDDDRLAFDESFDAITADEAVVVPVPIPSGFCFARWYLSVGGVYAVRGPRRDIYADDDAPARV